MNDQLFQQYRALLFSIAYHILGSVSEAEDMVQESYLRLMERQVKDLQNPRAYLAKIVTHCSLDRRRALQQARESYLGPWLPEPWVSAGWEETADPQAPYLSYGILHLLERLSAPERAVYVLHGLFDFSYATLAEILDRQEAACRQLYKRARSKIASAEKRFQPSPEQVAQLATAFQAASQAGELSPLISLLQEEVTVYSDGGGKVLAALKPIKGKLPVSHFLLGVQQFIAPDTQYRQIRFNGEPGILAYTPGNPITAMGAQWEAGGIKRLYFVRNPDKLQHLLALCV